eukprot:3588658-Pleurochrysis_carterae.AAC.1
MSALATGLQRETARERGRSSAPAATSTDVLPVSAVRAKAVASSTPSTAAASVASSTLVPAAVSAAVASSPTFHATSHGDGRTSWLPEPIHVPPSPPSLTNEVRRVLLALREEEAGQ